MSTEIHNIENDVKIFMLKKSFYNKLHVVWC